MTNQLLIVKATHTPIDYVSLKSGSVALSYKVSFWYHKKFKQGMKKAFVKNILSSSTGYSIICLGMSFCSAMVIILGELFGEFPLYIRMTDFKSCEADWCQM